MTITFPVDAVRPASKALDESRLAALLEEKIDGRLLLCPDGDQPLLAGVGGNPLVSAVHAAFSEHRPLVLSPDVVWLTIAQGFAQHVKNNAEALRARLVRRRQGKLELRVSTLSAETAEDWTRIVQAFGRAIGEHVGPGLCRLVTCDFSTTTDATRLASQVALMDTFVRYFDYICQMICGIPEVTLLGTVEDWQAIERRVEVIAEYDLSWWTDWLRPICAELARSAAGEVNGDFWQCIYMPQEDYGDKLVTGWVARLFPYVKSSSGAYAERNPVLAERGTHPSPFAGDAPEPTRARRRWISDGIFADVLPPGVAQVPVQLEHEGERHTVELFAGLMGVAQDRGTAAVWPHISWGLLERPIARVIERIRREHGAQLAPGQPPMEEHTVDHAWITAAPGELLALLAQVDGATLFGGAFRLRRRDELEAAERGDESRGSGLRFCDLDDGSFLATVAVFPTDAPHEFWVVRGLRDGTLGPAERCPVIARGIMPFFERLLDSHGERWFDAPGFQPEAMLSDEPTSV